MKRPVSIVAILIFWVFVSPRAATIDPLGEASAAYIAGDYAAAARMFRPLAEQGYAEAQFSLGRMYENGWGVAQDFVMAHMWFNIAGANGAQNGTKSRDRMAEKLTNPQIVDAQVLAREWIATKGLKATEGTADIGGGKKPSLAGSWLAVFTLTAGPAGCPLDARIPLKFGSTKFDGKNLSGETISGHIDSEKNIKGFITVPEGFPDFDAVFDGQKFTGNWQAIGYCDGKVVISRTE